MCQWLVGGGGEGVNQAFNAMWLPYVKQVMKMA
jgi:hypothetical protein